MSSVRSVRFGWPSGEIAIVTGMVCALSEVSAMIPAERSWINAPTGNSECPNLKLDTSDGMNAVISAVATGK